MHQTIIFQKPIFNLGLNYYEGKTIPRDIKKAIYYFSLASNQKYTSAYFKLGFIYSDGKYVIIEKLNGHQCLEKCHIFYDSFQA